MGKAATYFREFDWAVWLLTGALLGVLGVRGCDSLVEQHTTPLTGAIDTSLRPNVSIADSSRTDTVTKFVDRTFFIDRATPTTSDSARATLDTVLTDDGATLAQHIEYDKRDDRFTMHATFDAAIRVLERFVYRWVTVETPRLVQVTEPDTDDWWYFGSGALAASAVLLAFLHFIIHVL